ncbi:MAG: class I SAM-dependent methyltransferase, partial [Parvularculaceae bacterium]
DKNRAPEAGVMKKITHCRACGSKALSPAFSLSGLGTPASGLTGRRNGDLDFVYCDPMRDARACGLLQSAQAGAEKETVDEPSGRYASTRNHLRQMATEALELISGRDCSALDIGCSDGTLLSFYPRWVERFGVDLSSAVEQVGDWAWTAKAEFPSPELDRAFGGKKFDIITAASVFERIDEPRSFLARVKSLLGGDGVFVLETVYAPMTLTRTSIETIAGGAVSIYSLGVLERLVRDSGLKIFRGLLTDKGGGSVRLFITHAEAEDHDFDPWYERLARLWDEENALSLRSHAPYQAFERRANEARTEFRKLLGDAAGRGESAHVLGAGPASAAIVALAGAEARAITYAVGRTPSPKVAGLPVISETDSRAAEPDYLIAPASLKREMLERWRESIMLGAKLIVATPAPHVITAGNYAPELAKTLAAGDGAGGVETLRAILGASGAPRLVAQTPVAQTA